MKTLLYRVKNCHFSRVSCSVRNFLQYTHFMSILSKRSSQASRDSVMYMGDGDIRQQAIKEDNGIFPIICLHIAIRKVQISALNFLSCTLVILSLLFTCCMSYFSEKPMQFCCWKLCCFTLVCLFPVISTIHTYHNIVLARVSMGNGAMGLLV